MPATPWRHQSAINSSSGRRRVPGFTVTVSVSTSSPKKPALDHVTTPVDDPALAIRTRDLRLFPQSGFVPNVVDNARALDGRIPAVQSDDVVSVSDGAHVILSGVFSNTEQL
jgi:hypothetical protein